MAGKKNKITPLQRLWKLLKPDSKEIRNIYIYSTFNGIVGLSLPLGIQAIINFIQGGMVNSAWIVLVVLVVMGVAVSGVIKIMQFRITENLQQKIFTRGALEFAYRIPRIKMEEIYKHHVPELVNRYFDIMSIQKGLSKLLIDFSAASLQVFFGLILLSLYHPFFIIFSFILLLLILAIFRLTAKRGLETSLRESSYKYKLAHWLEELARTVMSFKLSGKTNLPMEKTDLIVTKYLTEKEKHFNVLVQQYSMLVFFKVVVAAGLLILGGILVIEQVINIGQFVAAEIIILLVIDSVEKLIMSLENIYDVITAVEKIGEVTDIELDDERGIDLVESCKTGGMKIEIKDMEFTYPYFNKSVISNINLNIESGERVLIVGKNGSGKTTFLNLIAGLYDLQKGYIAYDGLPKGNINISSLRTVIGDSMNQGLLFNGTILENITMGRKEATMENVRWIEKNLFLSDFIKTQPRGYETVIDPLGKKLSLSITGKILLARSMATKPKILILENAVEQIDETKRKHIIDFITSKENPWTLVAISSDSYFAQKMDTVILMENGSIAGKGSFEEMKALI